MESDLPKLIAANKALSPIKGEERWLTGYTDASYKIEPPGQGGGYGLWVRDSHTRILRSGPCPDWVACSNDAELCGVFAAIHTAMTRLHSEWANIMVIKTDSQAVARWFGWRSPRTSIPRTPERLDLVVRGLEAATSRGIRLVVTWVKGHRGKRDTSAYLNTMVDKLAGEARISREHNAFEKLIKEN